MADESLRDALEAAYDGQEPAAPSPPETGGSPKDTPEPIRDTAPTERSEPVTKDEAPTSGERKRGPDGKFLKTSAELQAEADKAAQLDTSLEATATDQLKPEVQSFKAPESWKPAVREAWAKIPPEAQAEIHRREQDMNQFVQRTSGMRKLADQFIGVVNPYMGMIQAEGGNPIETVQNLLQTAAFLRTGPSAQKATMVAKLVKDFGISVQDLDAALAGEAIPDDPDEKFRRLIDEKLQPVQEILGTVTKAKQDREKQVSSEVDSEIEKFAGDPANEFFKDVFQDMADMVEMSAKRGQQLTLKAAYDRAVQYNPEVQEVLRKRREAKQNAGSSLQVKGPSMGAPANPNGTLRDDLLASMDSVANRSPTC